MMSKKKHLKRFQDYVRKKLQEMKSNIMQSQRAVKSQLKLLIEPLKTFSQQNVGPKMNPKSSNEESVKEQSNGDLLLSYLKLFQTDRQVTVDPKFGMHNHGESWKMGSYPVIFSGDNIVDDVRYIIMPGLL